MAQRTDVMISSTARDLPEHRDQALDACIRQGMFPIMMEHLPPSDAEAVSASLKMVDEAEIYLGIFAYRYGYIPKGYDISVTEMEYNRAVERGIPRLIYIMDKKHPITPEQMGEGLDDEEEEARRRAKLNTFKKRLQTDNIVNYFTSPQEFRALAINGLSQHRKRGEAGSDIHYVSDIPTPPEAYIAHPYTLMHASRLFGRREELNLLTDWVAVPSSAAYQVRIMNIVAIGGMGKSALTWHWFNEIAPHEMKPLDGRMWWSFYESDAHFENFIIRALAYVTGRHHDEIRRETKPGEREDMLLRELDQKPYLFVLDGLERVLIAYARMDAARLSDDDYDKQAANYVAGIHGLPEGAGEQFVGQIQLRKTADPRAGNFLRKLAQVKASRILVSTRLYPAELQSITGYPIPGSAARFLTGLHDDDALNLWRDLGVSGGRDELLRVFNRFDNYPLLIRALAGEVARFRRAPGNFDAWQDANPDFTPVLHKLRQEDTKSHVLSYALKDLATDRRAVLTTLAAFRAPAGYDTLAALMVGEKPSSPNPFSLRAKGNEESEGSDVSPIESALRQVEDGEREKYRAMSAEVMVRLARGLRQRETDAEARLWECLRDRRLNGLKFRRQHPVAGTAYVVDFFCYEHRLVIELDGAVHDVPENAAVDAQRQRDIEALDHTVLRFRNEQVTGDLESVLSSILAATQPHTPSMQPSSFLESNLQPQPASPRPEGEGLGVRAIFSTECDLDAALDELEQRGLIGWDRRANRYDLHPIVRGVTWGNVGDDDRRDVYEALRGHFESVQKVDEDDVNTLEDLTPAIELYQALIGLGQYDKAELLFYERLDKATYYRLSANRQRIELLEQLFSNGLDQVPPLSRPDMQAFALNALAVAYNLSGQPGRALPIYRQSTQLAERLNNWRNVSVVLGNLSSALRPMGKLHEAETAVRHALIVGRMREDRFLEAISLYWWGMILAVRNTGFVSIKAALSRSLKFFVEQNNQQSEGITHAYLAQAMLWRSDFVTARELADRAWELAHVRRNEGDFTQSTRIQGEAALGLDDFDTASERLHHALTRARAVNLVEEELQALIALAEMARRQNNPDEARRLLDDVWEAAERGPYPLFHADALNVLAQIERDAGNHDAAVAAATKAYQKAWCDGPPFAYHWGLEKAKAHLDALGAAYPDMPPFDESKYEPMPEVEIDPPDGAAG